jgi:hypothetical protein
LLDLTENKKNQFIILISRTLFLYYYNHVHECKAAIVLGPEFKITTLVGSRIILGTTLVGSQII